MLPPLRMRAHKTTVKMEYDERYTPFFRRARLLGFVLQFKRKPPTLVHSALTALIDRWRPETHSFHLPCGEMTVTLEDWAMITALPLEGRALTGRVERANWHERVVSLIGDCPPPPLRATGLPAYRCHGSSSTGASARKMPSPGWWSSTPGPTCGTFSRR